MKEYVAILVFAIATLVAGPAIALQTTGTITGVVKDEQGGVLPGATIEVIDEQTRDTRRTVSNEAGVFNVTALPQGRYTLRILFTNFRTIERAGIQLRSSETFDAATMTMRLGGLTESTTVTSELAVVQTATAVRTAVLEAQQLDSLVARGRDPVSLLNLLPGALPNTGTTILGGTTGTGVPTIAGQPGGSTSMAVDGMPSNDGDLTGNNNSPMSMDAVEEIRVVLNGYAAEFGRGSGAQINLVSKSGSQRYSGSLATYVRHDALNSNTVQNERSGLPKPYYRYYTATGTLGGPVVLPGAGRLDRTFFFYNREMWDTKLPANIRNSTMPTDAERRGDFSQTTHPNGSRFFIADPLLVQQGLACSSTTGGPGCFANNIVPANRLNALGVAMVDRLPGPNFDDRTVSQGNYNYRDQDIGHRTASLDMITVEHGFSDIDRFKGTFRRWAPNRRAYTGVFGDNSSFNHFRGQYAQSEKSVQFNYTRTLSTTMVNELTFSFRRTPEGGPVDSNPDPISLLQRGPQNLSGLGRLFSGDPRLNPLDLIPQMNFGNNAGLSNGPNVSWDARFPIDAGDDRYTWTNNFTWTRGSHLVKAGIFAEFDTNSEGESANCFSGCVNFASTGTAAAQNPFNTNHPYANALLGYYTTYEESNVRPIRGGKMSFAEWFVQDSWKVRSNITLELGARFASVKPWHLMEGYQGAGFALDALNAAANPLLYAPACPGGAATCAAGVRLARNPLTGAVLPNSTALIGQLVPNSGDFYNGMVLGTDPLGYGGQFMETPGIQAQPRLGFAWDPFSDGKMSVRGNYGLATQVNESSGSFAGSFPLAPPVRLQPTLFYGSVSDIGVAAQQQVFAPQSVTGFAPGRTPRRRTHNFALEVQRNVGFDTVVSAAYVGNRQRDLSTTRNINLVPVGARFDPRNADPTSAARATLADAFLRPLPQFNNVNVLSNEGYANYDSLQLTANRRFNRRFGFGFSYTLSALKDLQGTLNVFPDVFGDQVSRFYDYGNADRRHIGSAHFTFDVPNGSAMWNHALTRGALDGWQFAGVYLFQSGAPSAVTYTTTDAGGTDTMGGGDAVRITILPGCDVQGASRTEEQWFNTACFARTPRGEIGNAPRQVIRQPGRQNLDLTLSKSFGVGGGDRRLQFRAEIYNALSLTTRDADTSATFDAAGNQTDTNFGRLNLPEGEARVVQLSLRFQF